MYYTPVICWEQGTIGDYNNLVLNNLQPGEAVVIIDYKMKLELGVSLREIQRDWYGKRGISLHGLLAIAQVDENKKVSEVLDLWSEDTKQDSWFTQSAMDVGFTWLQKAFPGFRVYLFSGTSWELCSIMFNNTKRLAIALT